MNLEATSADIARSGTWFKTLPAEFSDALLSNAQILQLNAGQRVFARGDAPSGFFCILRGSVRMCAHLNDGREALIAVMEAPQWFGEISVVDEGPRTHDIWTQQDCDLLHVPQAQLLAYLKENPQYWRNLGQLVAQRLRTIFSGIEEQCLLPPTPRLAGRLLMMSGNYGAWDQKTKRTLHISQEELALMLSVTRQTINESLRDLEAQGVLIRRRGSIEIVSVEGLQSARDH